MTNKKPLFFVGGGLVLAAVFAASFFILFAKESIEGKVMVVQRNAEVRKLALVRIYAVSESDAQVWHDDVIRRCRGILDASVSRRAGGAVERKRIVAENDSMIRRYEELLDAAVEMRDFSREFWIVDPNQPTKKNKFFEKIALPGMPSSREVEEDAMSSRWDRCYEALRRSVVPELEARLQRARERKESELKDHDAALARDLSELKRALQKAMSFESLTEIPDGIRIASSVLSDDNGEYRLKVPKGRYYLFARGSRTVFDKEEKYYWVKKVSAPSDESTRCLLGNNNMLDGDENHLWSDLEPLLRNHAELK